MSATDDEVLSRQVKEWEKEIARLQDMISAATVLEQDKQGAEPDLRNTPRNRMEGAMAELLPCPFCGSDNVDYLRPSNCWFVVCNACEAEGPVEYSEGKAAEVWNNRAAPADKQGGGLTDTEVAALKYAIAQCKASVLHSERTVAEHLAAVLARVAPSVDLTGEQRLAVQYAAMRLDLPDNNPEQQSIVRNLRTMLAAAPQPSERACTCGSGPTGGHSRTCAAFDESMMHDRRPEQPAEEAYKRGYEAGYKDAQNSQPVRYLRNGGGY